MRLKIVLECASDIKLPRDYNYILQSSIYKFMEERIPNLHSLGMEINNRKLRPFVLSKIYGKYDVVNGGICFKSPISIYIASPVDEIIKGIGNQYFNDTCMKLLDYELKPVEISVLNPKIEKDSIRVKTLSPITVRSTLETKDGKKKSYFYNPYEKDFQQQIKENLIRKYKSLGNEVTEEEFNFRTIGTAKQRISKYKGFVIVAWDGTFEMSGNKELLNLAFNWGLGSRNAQGFGMITEQLNKK